MGNLVQRVIWPHTCAEFFNQWGGHYMGNFKKKAIFKRFWDALPKYICWSIWLARNKRIFNDEIQSSRMVATKACALLVEYMKNWVQWKEQPLDHTEEG
jgi:hypothetical protein